MFNDLPEDRVAEINAMLRGGGYNARVLTDECDDEATRAGAQSYFSVTRKYIDDILTSFEIKARIHVCMIEDDPSVFQACAIRFTATEFCIAVWLGVVSRSLVVPSHLLATEAASEFFALPASGIAMPEAPVAGNTFEAFLALGLISPPMLPEASSMLRYELSAAAFRWLVLHEIGHVINGHLEYGRNLAGLNVIFENDPSSDMDDNLTGQAMEMDADSFATLLSIQPAMRTPSQLEEINKMTSWEEIEPLRAKIYGFAIFAMIRGFDFEAFTFEQIFSNDHPPGGMRINYTLSQIATIALMDKVTTVTHEVLTSVASVVVVLEKAISQATGLPSRGGNLLTASAIAWDEYHKPVLARWAKLYPVLNARKLNPSKLAPPQYDPA